MRHALNHITLSWTASTGGALVGYHVYRSADGVTFTKLTTVPVATLAYDDPIASPAGDGVFYFYRVTAVSTLESNPSATVKQTHGERVTSSTTGYASLSHGYGRSKGPS